MIDYTTIGKAIRTNRLRCQFTQEELAEKVDVATDYISKIENAVKHPSLKMLDKLANIFDVDMCSLITGSDPTKSDYGISALADIVRDFEPETKILILKTAESFSDIDQTLKDMKK